MQHWANIIENKTVRAGYHLMRLHAPEVAMTADPGQFVHLRVNDSYSPLLRRPISLHRIDAEAGTIDLLYQVRGAGTKALSEKKPGQRVDLMGPLGNGFKLDFPGSRTILAAGGIGVAPLLPLAEALLDQGKKVTLLLGGRSIDHLLAADGFFHLGCQVRLVTDDGTAGMKGFVTDLLLDELQQEAADAVYACGPGPMLGKVEQICLERGIPGQVSLEEYMACGVGACLGCVCAKNVPGEIQYAKVCTDGPVFNFGEVKISHGC